MNVTDAELGAFFDKHEARYDDDDANFCEECEADWPCVTARIGMELHRLHFSEGDLLAATAELRRGDGTYYLTEERAMAPGIADGWPDVIPAPHTKNGRLVKRKFAIVDAQ